MAAERLGGIIEMVSAAIAGRGADWLRGAGTITVSIFTTIPPGPAAPRAPSPPQGHAVSRGQRARWRGHVKCLKVANPEAMCRAVGMKFR